MIHALTPALLVLALGGVRARNAEEQDSPPAMPTDPDRAQLVTSDIDNFWDAFDLSTMDDQRQVFQEFYLDSGSIGLDEFTRIRIGDVDQLLLHVNKFEAYYASIRESSLRIGEFENQIRAAFYALKHLYPPAVFPDVYFLIGRLSSGGTLTEKGLLIGTEMYGRTEESPVEILGSWLQTVLKPIEAVPHIVAHELIHYQQQYGPDPSLLAQAIREGSADFIAELISGHHINGHLHDWGNPREEELWSEFKAQMTGTDTTQWLYNGGSSQSRPGDLGYYMGYKICAAYLKQHGDRRGAVQDILNIQDFPAFLRKSKYAEKFKPR